MVYQPKSGAQYSPVSSKYVLQNSQPKNKDHPIAQPLSII